MELLSNDETEQPYFIDATKDLPLIILGMFGAVGVDHFLLTQLEWFQTLRYVWPLSFGGLFMLEAILGCKRSAWTMIRGVLGFGMFIGGVADATLPVYITGPNLFTHAGLLPDCAAILFLLQTIPNQTKGIAAPIEYSSSKSNLLHALFLSQLYILGEGAFEEILGLSENMLP